MYSVNERTTFYLTVTFLDKDGQQSTPTSVSYTVHDKGTDTEVSSGSTDAASQVEIEVGAAVNAILVNSRKTEKRVVTVTATYGVDDELNGVFEYSVTNLSYKE